MQASHLFDWTTHFPFILLKVRRKCTLSIRKIYVFRIFRIIVNTVKYHVIISQISRRITQDSIQSLSFKHLVTQYVLFCHTANPRLIINLSLVTNFFVSWYSMHTQQFLDIIQILASPILSIMVVMNLRIYIISSLLF